MVVFDEVPTLYTMETLPPKICKLLWASPILSLPILPKAIFVIQYKIAHSILWTDKGFYNQSKQQFYPGFSLDSFTEKITLKLFGFVPIVP